ELAVDQRDLEIDHREAGKDARSQNRFETLLDARDELLGHRAADDLVFELEAGARRQRLSDDLHGRELASAASLLLVRVVDGHLPAAPLTIGHLRRADRGF